MVTLAALGKHRGPEASGDGGRASRASILSLDLRFDVGRRSSFQRRDRDLYPTPVDAVLPLLAHLPDRFTFAEPCAGDGRLVWHLEILSGGVVFLDVGYSADRSTDHGAGRHGTKRQRPWRRGVDPPWSRPILHPLVEHLPDLAPIWLLFDAGWAYTRRSE